MLQLRGKLQRNVCSVAVKGIPSCRERCRRNNFEFGPWERDTSSGRRLCLECFSCIRASTLHCKRTVHRASRHHARSEPRRRPVIRCAPRGAHRCNHHTVLFQTRSAGLSRSHSSCQRAQPSTTLTIARCGATTSNSSSSSTGTSIANTVSKASKSATSKQEYLSSYLASNSLSKLLRCRCLASALFFLMLITIRDSINLAHELHCSYTCTHSRNN
mmetsp:Transcript_7235/g.15478  ORF Transcript_7235/g.15478 Transcript_7235/m.15478 type:complete len:216 (-) Transcript_7235:24-671(-)